MGILITFEGIEGCGKTTQIELLCDYLKAQGGGRGVVSLREPGGTEAGERVRRILLDPKLGGMSPLAECFLYQACRAELVAEVIRPALAQDKVVLCDRYIDSTVAYQGYARGLSLDMLCVMNDVATGGLVPALTFLLDCSPRTGLSRAWERIGQRNGGNDEAGDESRFEKEALPFHEAVRKGFLEIASREPDRIKVVDTEKGVRAVHKEICAIVDRTMARFVSA